MVLLSFSCEEKKETLLNKECSQTIRPVRKNPIEEGDELQIYWKVRKAKDKKDVHKIGEGVVTEAFEVVFLNYFGERESEKELARRDGFDSVDDMIEWFRDKYDTGWHKKTFKVIRWDWRLENDR